ncbi:Acetylcholine receptor subunit alpha-like 1, partial [Gryllus bimaculatus]
MLRPGPRALLLSFFLQILATGTSQVTCPTRHLNYEKELKKCLLQDYERTLEHDSQMKIHAWTIWEWTDNNLKWNPGDFGNVRSIKMLSDDIWQPDISLMTTDDANMHFGLPSTYCQVSNLGKVLCAPPTTLLGHCVPDITRWPFDEQTCSIVMGSWSQLASTLNLTISGTGITLNKLPNGLWDLKWASARVVLTQHGKSDYYPTIEYTFALRRHSAADTSTAVAPALVAGDDDAAHPAAGARLLGAAHHGHHQRAGARALPAIHELAPAAQRGHRACDCGVLPGLAGAAGRGAGAGRGDAPPGAGALAAARLAAL